MLQFMFACKVSPAQALEVPWSICVCVCVCVCVYCFGVILCLCIGGKVEHETVFCLEALKLLCV